MFILIQIVPITVDIHTLIKYFINKLNLINKFTYDKFVLKTSIVNCNLRKKLLFGNK